MQGIKTENKERLEVYINGVPNIKNIPLEITECLVDYLLQKIVDNDIIS